MTRADLHSYLESFGMKVYYQPPNNDELTLPCIIYDLVGIENEYANGKTYIRRKEYEIKYAYSSKTKEFLTEHIIDGIEYSSYVNSYTKDNVITDVIKIYI